MPNANESIAKVAKKPENPFGRASAFLKEKASRGLAPGPGPFLVSLSSLR